MDDPPGGSIASGHAGHEGPYDVTAYGGNDHWYFAPMYHLAFGEMVLYVVCGLTMTLRGGVNCVRPCGPYDITAYGGDQTWCFAPMKHLALGEKDNRYHDGDTMTLRGGSIALGPAGRTTSPSPFGEFMSKRFALTHSLTY